MLEISLFGSPQISLAGQIVDINRRKSRALIYYLAGHVDPISRERLLSIFWPDLPRSSALQTLRTTLYSLRKSLDPYLEATDEELFLASDTFVDVRAFEQSINAPDDQVESLQTALDYYRGDFLADFYLPDSAAFEDWQVYQREYYRRLAVRGLLELSRAYEQSGDFTSALSAIDRALSFDSLQEDLQRESIRLTYLGGDRPGAIRRYDQLRKLLDDQMGVPPMAETRALYDLIINGKPIPSADSPTPLRKLTTSPAITRVPALPLVPFIGRSKELEQLKGWQSTDKLVLIEGEPGIGKTRLAQEFLLASSALVLVGAARELEQTLPYHPLREALGNLIHQPDWLSLSAQIHRSLPHIWIAETARLLPELEAIHQRPNYTSGIENESRLWEGLNQFLFALAHIKPVVLFIDDLHWADASTLGFLGYLARQDYTQVDFMLLATSRPLSARPPAGTLLHSLTNQNRIERLQLERLSKDEVTEIALKLSPDYAYALAEWLMRNSDGNPFVVSELVHYALENKILVANSKQHYAVNLSALSEDPVVPKTVYSLIQQRIQRLSDGARRLLSAAVAAGRRFDFETTYRAAALSEPAAIDALDELIAAHLINSADNRLYAFDHPLTMEVVYREEGEARHRLMHRRIAEAIEATHSPQRREQLAGVIAFHYFEGQAPERAAPYAFLAGQQADQLSASSETMALFEQALTGTEGIERFPILIALGNTRALAGKPAEASEALTEALALAQLSGDPAKINQARLAWARALLPLGRYEEVIALARQVLTTGLPENAMDAEFLWGTALSLEGEDLNAAAEHLHNAEKHCRQARSNATGEAPLNSNVARIRFELGSIYAQQGDLQKAVELYHQARQAASQVEGDEALQWLILANNNLAYHLLLLGDPQAGSYAQTGLEIAQEKGVLGPQPYLYSTLGEIALANQQIELAESYFNKGLSLAQQLGNADRIAGLTANLGRVANARGETSLAIHQLSVALSHAETLNKQYLVAQIRLWLAPLLPAKESRKQFALARAFAESGHRRYLLEQISQLDHS